MSLDPGKVLERSVDSISRIYAVVIALAVSQSVQTLIKDPKGGVTLSPDGLATAVPAFMAFLFTLVPFWHGMNRHLDRCYLQKAGTVAQGALLFDFAVFFVEAGLLFASGWSLRSGLVSFYCLGLLLVSDMVWGFISHQIHFPGQKSHSVRWSKINVCIGVLAVLVVAFPFQKKPFVLMVLAIARTIADYWFCWDFYFPAAAAGVQPQGNAGAASARRGQ
jgi:hypothetical protein